MQVSTLINEVVSGLDLQLNIYNVSIVPAGYLCYVDSTQYLNTNRKLVIDGVTYTVVSFEHNVSVTLRGDTIPDVGSHTLANPYFTHGKLKAVNAELSSLDPVSVIPLIWMFELQPRTQPSEIDTIIESTGTVKMFFMATANYQDFTTQQHYLECINPMNNLVNAVKQGIIEHKRSGIVFEGLRMNHAKFTTGGGATASDENDVLPLFISGIELELTLPITQDLSCPTRVIPASEGKGFDSGFDSGFEIEI